MISEADYFKEQLQASNDMMAMTTRYLMELQDKLEDKNKQLADSNNRILSSIRFAELIQSSLLPDIAPLQKHFQHSTYHVAQQIGIGGDSVFIRENDEGVHFGLFDSTGHGVPASMLNISSTLILRELIPSLYSKDTGKILDKLNGQLFHTFRNDRNSIAHQEGSLFFYAHGSRRLSYSSANGKGLLIGPDKTIITIESSRNAIGEKENSNFTEYSFQFEKGSRVLIYSDGLVDQFGGQNDKKFTRKRLTKLLADNFNANTLELSEIIKHEFMNWKGNSDQTDDVSYLLIES